MEPDMSDIDMDRSMSVEMEVEREGGEGAAAAAAAPPSSASTSTATANTPRFSAAATTSAMNPASVDGNSNANPNPPSPSSIPPRLLSAVSARLHSLGVSVRDEWLTAALSGRVRMVQYQSQSQSDNENENERSEAVQHQQQRQYHPPPPPIPISLFHAASAAALPPSLVDTYVSHAWRLCLLSDLSLICHPCLPSNVGSMIRQNVDGQYILQLMQAVDVAKPIHQQHEEDVDGWQQQYEDEMEEKSASGRQGQTHRSGQHGKGKASTSFSACGPRRLKLALSDGGKFVCAMERVRCPQLLDDQLKAGVKLVVRDVSVRYGCLLLRPENVQLLGGAAPKPNTTTHTHTNTQQTDRSTEVDAETEAMAEGAAAAAAAYTAERGGQEEKERGRGSVSWSAAELASRGVMDAASRLVAVAESHSRAQNKNSAGACTVLPQPVSAPSSSLSLPRAPHQQRAQHKLSSVDPSSAPHQPLLPPMLPHINTSTQPALPHPHPPSPLPLPLHPFPSLDSVDDEEQLDQDALEAERMMELQEEKMQRRVLEDGVDSAEAQHWPDSSTTFTTVSDRVACQSRSSSSASTPSVPLSQPPPLERPAPIALHMTEQKQSNEADIHVAVAASSPSSSPSEVTIDDDSPSPSTSIPALPPIAQVPSMRQANMVAPAQTQTQAVSAPTDMNAARLRSSMFARTSEQMQMHSQSAALTSGPVKQERGSASTSTSTSISLSPNPAESTSAPSTGIVSVQRYQT